MVKLVRVERDGRISWVEATPQECPAGHPGPVPTWGQCVECGYACRHWRCDVGGCGVVIRDPDHECVSRTAAP
jgi:hypothetical protein